MPRSSAMLDQLFDRAWRPGRPLRPRLSPLRRYGMFCLLCFLLSVIAAYWILTDANRVRKMCESYLSRITGGQVEVRGASLSIFEGLRLEGVSVRVDPPGGSASDSSLFDVQTVLIKYNPESILSGKLEATEIIAIDPRVRLCENVDLTVARWNYQRLKLRPPSADPHGEKKPMVLPQIKLRNGQVHISQMHQGKLTSQGVMALDGSLSPGETLGTYLFSLQSRVQGQTMGPTVMGEGIPSTGEIHAHLKDFSADAGIAAMVPEMVRHSMEEYGLAGRVDADVDVWPNTLGGTPEFRVDMVLKQVDLSASPDEWLSRAERGRITTLHNAFELMRVIGMNGNGTSGFADLLQSKITPVPVRLEKVDGQFIFTPKGISIHKLTGRLERNDFHIEGHIDGYNTDAPATLRVVCEDLNIPHSPRYANAMPRVIRMIYETLRPEGSGRLWVTLVRPEPGQKPVVAGELEIHDGRIQVDPFPYPLRNLHGKVAFGPDPLRGDKLELIDLHANGKLGGPNEKNTLTINGLISPIDGDSEMNVQVVGEHIVSEPAIRAALPPEARDVLDALDPDGKGLLPTFKSHIIADIHRPPGPNMPFGVTLTMDLEDGAGAFEGFSYPIEHMTGRVVIGADYVNLVKCIAKKDGASVMLDGRMTFGRGKPLTPDLTLTARNVPIDKTLLKAIAPERREWLEKLGITGRLDVDGKIFLKTKVVARKTQSEVEVDLEMKVHDGALWPRDSTYAVSEVSGNLHLSDGQVTFSDFVGTRGGGKIGAAGKVTWEAGRPVVAITATAKNLLLESALYQLLPKDAQAAWDSVQPEGTVDVAMQFGEGGKLIGKAPTSTAPSTAPSTQSYAISLTPVKLAATAKELPYRLTDLSGRIDITPRGTTLTDMSGRHNNARLWFEGEGINGPRSSWSLRLSGRDVPVDEELRKALPTSSAQLIDSMKLKGKMAFDFTQLDYRAGDARPIGKPADVDLDLAGTMWFDAASMEVGVPVSEFDGSLQFEAGIRKGKLGGFKGLLEGRTLKIAGRAAKDLSMDLYKPADQDAMRLTRIRGSLAGGEIAGKVALGFPDNGPSRFVLDLLLRNADVTQLTGEKDIRGQATASLALEGDWNDPATRRGRGDVAVAGHDMYHIPLMLGLMQVTNLSLPISSPFSEASSRYSVDGQKITFESIELHAPQMLMKGSGSMNFETKKVKLTFVTDNPNWPKVPLVNDLIQGAKHELLQIRVNGTIEEPKVSAGVMSTFQTTIDEVFRGDQKK